MVENFVVERNGNRYVYRSTSVYDPDTHKKRTISEYVGRLDPHTGEIVEKRKNKKSSEWGSAHPVVRKYGACHVLASVSESIGLTSDVVEAFGSGGRNMIAAAISLILSNEQAAGIFAEMESNMSRQIYGLNGTDAPWMTLDSASGVCTDDRLDDLFRTRIQRAGKVILRASPTASSDKSGCGNYIVATDSDGMPVFLSARESDVPFARGVLYTSNAIIGRGAEKVTAVLDRGSVQPEILRYLAVSGVPFLAIADPGIPLSKTVINAALKERNSGSTARCYRDRPFTVSESTSAIVRDKDPRRQSFSFVQSTPDDRRGLRTWACIPLNTSDDGLTARLESLADRIGTMTSYDARAFLSGIDRDDRHYLDVDLSGDMAIARIRRKAVTASRNRQNAFVILSDCISTWEEAMGYYEHIEVPWHVSEFVNKCLTSVIDPSGKLSNVCDTGIRFIALNIWFGMEKIVSESKMGEPSQAILGKLDPLYAVSNGESWATSQQSPGVKRVLKALGMPINKVVIR